MKNIIFIALVITLITSCGQNITTLDSENKAIESDSKNNITSIEEIPSQDSTLWKITPADQIKKEEENTRKALLPELEKNINKLKNIDVSGEEIERLHSDVKNILIRTVTQNAITHNSIEQCNSLDENIIDTCKTEVIIQNTDDDTLCKELSSEENINTCKNTFNKTKALEELDADICKKILNWQESTSCQSRVLLLIARNNLDVSTCEWILDTFEKEQCIYEVEEEIKMKKELPEPAKTYEEDVSNNIN